MYEAAIFMFLKEVLFRSLASKLKLYFLCLLH